MPQRRAKPPASGTLPAHGRRILTAAYESAKARALEQGKSPKAAKRAASAQAWCAVKRSYYKKGAKWVKRKATLGKSEQPPNCKPLRRRKNPALSPEVRAVLQRLADTAERTGDDWGTITAIDGYLEDPDDDRTPIKYLIAVDKDVDWNLKHVGETDEDDESAKRAHKQIANAIRELEALQTGGAAYQQALEAALASINRDRARRGERPLDPGTAGWTDEDVLTEARRISKNPSSSEIVWNKLERRDASDPPGYESDPVEVNFRDRPPWGRALAVFRLWPATHAVRNKMKPLKYGKQTAYDVSVLEILEVGTPGRHKWGAGGGQISVPLVLEDAKRAVDLWLEGRPFNSDNGRIGDVFPPGYSTPKNNPSETFADLLKRAEHEIVVERRVAKHGTDRAGLHAAYALNLIESAVDKATTQAQVEKAWRVLKKLAKANVMVEAQAGRYHVVETGIRNAMKRYDGNPYLGDAVELSQRRKYEEERSRWEKGGRRGPPPAPPRSRQRNPRTASLSRRITGV